LTSADLGAFGIRSRQAEAVGNNLIFNTVLEYSHVEPSVYVVFKDADMMTVLIVRKIPDDSIILIFLKSDGS